MKTLPLVADFSLAGGRFGVNQRFVQRRPRTTP